MEVETNVISTSEISKFRKNQPQRRRRSSSTSLSPAKENQSETNSKVVYKRKRTKSTSGTACRTSEKLTFWGWSPKKAKFKPKIMDEHGEMTDHPHPEAVAIRSKWQPIVINFFYKKQLKMSINRVKM